MELHVRIVLNLRFNSCLVYPSVTNYGNPAALAGV